MISADSFVPPGWPHAFVLGVGVYTFYSTDR